MKFREATPIRHRRGVAFVTRARGCGLEDVRTPSYDVRPEAHALAALRKEAGLGLHDAASKLGMRAVELSGLEHGRLVPEDRGEWARLTAALKAPGTEAAIRGAR